MGSQVHMAPTLSLALDHTFDCLDMGERMRTVKRGRAGELMQADQRYLSTVFSGD